MPEGILVISQALKVDLVSQSKPLLHPQSASCIRDFSRNNHLSLGEDSHISISAPQSSIVNLTFRMKPPCPTKCHGHIFDIRSRNEKEDKTKT